MRVEPLGERAAACVDHLPGAPPILSNYLHPACGTCG